MNPTCPKCSSTNLYWNYDCHTYPSGYNPDGSRRFMSCHPCDSAARYSCENCGWSFVHGLNKLNPRTEENEKNRPDWIVGDPIYNKFGTQHIVEGIPSIWDDDNDDE